MEALARCGWNTAEVLAACLLLEMRHGAIRTCSLAPPSHCHQCRQEDGGICRQVGSAQPSRSQQCCKLDRFTSPHRLSAIVTWLQSFVCTRASLLAPLYKTPPQTRLQRSLGQPGLTSSCAPVSPLGTMYRHASCAVEFMRHVIAVPHSSMFRKAQGTVRFDAKSSAAA